MLDVGEFSHAEVFKVIYCPTCVIPFAIPAEMVRRRQLDGKIFHCPNGHEQHWPEGKDLKAWKDKAEGVEKELHDAKQKIVRLTQELDQAQAKKADTDGK